MDTSCQPIDYLKAFKGKGALARTVKHADHRLRTLTDEMVQLKRKSRSVAGHTFALELYRRGQRVTLRWRLANGKHTNWRVVRPLVQCMPAIMRQWYQELHLQSLALNIQAGVAHYEARRIKDAEQQWHEIAGLQ